MAAYVCHASGCFGLERSIIAAVGYVRAVTGLECHPEEDGGIIAVISDGVAVEKNAHERIVAHAARSKDVRIGSIEELA